MNRSPIKPLRGLSVESVVSLMHGDELSLCSFLQSWCSLASDNRSLGTISASYSAPFFSKFGSESFLAVSKDQVYPPRAKSGCYRGHGERLCLELGRPFQRNGNLRRWSTNAAANNDCMLGMCFWPPNGASEKESSHWGLSVRIICVITQ